MITIRYKLTGAEETVFFEVESLFMAGSALEKLQDLEPLFRMAPLFSLRGCYTESLFLLDD